tara:strand:+ start:352 stop:816 length:465 start_codon:yes stop_codon:yes gene_type:complete
MESTPIQNLQQSNEGGEEDDSRIVQSILQEMNEQGQSMPEQNSAPQMQVMPQQQQQQYMQQEMPEYDPDDAYEAYEEVQEYKKETLVQTILREVREPLVVIALYVLTNLPMLDKLITKNIPKTMTNTGGVNIIGVSLKAVVVGIIFYIIKKFLC